MDKGKKYDCRIVQDKTGWTAEIVRRVTSKKFHVSKSKDGFASEAEAKEWGENEINSFLKNLVERNKRHSDQRTPLRKSKAIKSRHHFYPSL